MAETVHLYLKANGNPISGESTQESLDRKDSIECINLRHAVGTSREASNGLASGRRQYEPLSITKRLDASTPLLFKALAENQRIDGEFRFFRPHPDGDGRTQQFYTIEIENGRIEGIVQTSEDTLQAGSGNLPPMEEVRFVFSKISWTYVPNGITHEDSWTQNR